MQVGFFQNLYNSTVDFFNNYIIEPIKNSSTRNKVIGLAILLFLGLGARILRKKDKKINATPATSATNPQDNKTQNVANQTLSSAANQNKGPANDKPAAASTPTSVTAPQKDDKPVVINGMTFKGVVENNKLKNGILSTPHGDMVLDGEFVIEKYEEPASKLMEKGPVGKGKVQFLGATFDGTITIKGFSKGTFTEKGKDSFEILDGEIFLNKDGTFRGAANIKLKNNEEKNGTFENSKLHGIGTYTYLKDEALGHCIKSIYGFYENDQFDFKNAGTVTYYNGDVHKGKYNKEFKLDCEDGEIKYNCGDVEKGLFKNGKLNGSGIQIANGGYPRNIGIFIESRLTDPDGRIEYSEKFYRKGNFQDYELQGDGELVEENNYYKGKFLNDKYHGAGERIYIVDNTKFHLDGTFKEGLLDHGTVKVFTIEEDGTQTLVETLFGDYNLDGFLHSIKDEDGNLSICTQIKDGVTKTGYAVDGIITTSIVQDAKGSAKKEKQTINTKSSVKKPKDPAKLKKWKKELGYSEG